MIQTLSPKEMMRLFPWLLQDAGRNYFILLGLLDREPRFQQVFLQVGSSGEPVAALFQRISGNIQFYGGGVIDVQGFRQIIREIHASELIGFQSICNVLNVPDLFSEAREGAFLAEWNSCARLEPESKDIVNLREENLDAVVKLYSSVFSHFSSRSIMSEKLRSGRGRGVFIKKDGLVVAVAQTEMETMDSALIVGVATHPLYREQGLATQCLCALLQSLRHDEKTVVLQYDNPDAGKLYHRLGFEVRDRMIRYIR